MLNFRTPRLLAIPQDSTTALSPTLEECITARIDAFAAERRAFPASLRLNPCSIIDLPCEHWQSFQARLEGEVTAIPVIGDPTLGFDEIALDSADIEDMPTIAITAVGVRR